MNVSLDNCFMFSGFIKDSTLELLDLPSVGHDGQLFSLF